MNLTDKQIKYLFDNVSIEEIHTLMKEVKKLQKGFDMKLTDQEALFLIPERDNEANKKLTKKTIKAIKQLKTMGTTLNSALYLYVINILLDFSENEDETVYYSPSQRQFSFVDDTPDDTITISQKEAASKIEEIIKTYKDNENIYLYVCPDNAEILFENFTNIDNFTQEEQDELSYYEHTEFPNLFIGWD